MPSCFLVQRTDYVLVFGAFSSDLECVEYGISLL